MRNLAPAEVGGEVNSTMTHLAHFQKRSAAAGAALVLWGAVIVLQYIAWHASAWRKAATPRTAGQSCDACSGCCNSWRRGCSCAVDSMIR